MKTTREMKRKGFTLVELLIVIVVIGVLSAMMMLSSTEAVSSARASDIVSDLRNLKTAALAWYADHLDYVEGTVTPALTSLQSERANILKYMNNENIDAKYAFSNGKDVGEWFIWCQVTDSKVLDKLKSRAKGVGLCGATSANAKSTAISGDISSLTAGNSCYVGMFIR